MKTKSIRGTQTEKNVMSAFAIESQSHCRYLFFAKRAKIEGYPIVKMALKMKSKQKHMHAMAFYNMLDGGTVEVTATFPSDIVADTMSNLKALAINENQKWSEIYPEMAKVAQDEGFIHIATLFHYVMDVAKTHEEKLMHHAEQIKQKAVYSSKEEVTWKCRKCAHQHHGKTPPAVCPLCGSDMKFFQKVCGCGCGCTDCNCTK